MMSKLAFDRLLFKGCFMTPPWEGVKRWLVHIAVFAIVLSIALLFPIHYMQKVGPFLAAEYDYRVFYADKTEHRALVAQEFISSECSLYSTKVGSLSYGDCSAKCLVYCCDDAATLDLTPFGDARAIPVLGGSGSYPEGPFLILDYRVARLLGVGVGDEIEVKGSENPLPVVRICSTDLSFSFPTALVVWPGSPPASIVFKDALAAVYLDVSDTEAADAFFNDEYPYLSQDVSDEDRLLAAKQAVSTRAEDIEAASEEALSLGLIVVLFALGLTFSGLYAVRSACQLISLHSRDLATLRILGAGKRRLACSLAGLLAVELLSAELVAGVLSKCAVEYLTPFSYSWVEQWMLLAPYIALLFILVVCSSVLRAHGYEIERRRS